MNYTEKLRELEQVIDYLNENNFYNSLANRVYYFCFQSIILFLSGIYGSKEEYINDGDSTHKDTIDMYIKNKFTNPSDFRNKRDFNQEINRIKKLRMKADYDYIESITEEEAEDLMESFIKIRSLM